MNLDRCPPCQLISIQIWYGHLVLHKILIEKSENSFFGGDPLFVTLGKTHLDMLLISHRTSWSAVRPVHSRVTFLPARTVTSSSCWWWWPTTASADASHHCMPARTSSQGILSLAAFISSQLQWRLDWLHHWTISHCSHCFFLCVIKTSDFCVTCHKQHYKLFKFLKFCHKSCFLLYVQLSSICHNCNALFVFFSWCLYFIAHPKGSHSALLLTHIWDVCSSECTMPHQLSLKPSQTPQSPFPFILQTKSPPLMPYTSQQRSFGIASPTWFAQSQCICNVLRKPFTQHEPSCCANWSKCMAIKNCTLHKTM